MTTFKRTDDPITRGLMVTENLLGLSLDVKESELVLQFLQRCLERFEPTNSNDADWKDLCSKGLNEFINDLKGVT